MAKVINKKDRKLGFDSDEFQLVINKPDKNSVWYNISLKAGENEIDTLFREDHVSKKLAERLKTTFEAFMDSSFDTLILVGKVLNKKK